jgi:hypothetical protein
MKLICGELTITMKTTQLIKLFAASGVREAGGLTWKSNP